MSTQRPSRPWIALTLVVIASLACTFFGPGPTATPAFTPTPAASPTPLAPIAPNVIDHLPARGDELPPQGTITVYFDAPMDQASVETAFGLAPQVAGSFEWPDASTLVFKPASNLERATRYTVTIGAGARSQAGLELPEAFSFKADTVGFLEVAQVIPAPETTGVEVDAAITVMFNRPVVPLGALGDQASLPNPLALEPAVSGQGEWLNTSIFIFRPDQPLAGGVTYTGRVAAGLQDTTGGLLKDDFTWQFTPLGPDVVSTEPVFGALNVPLTQSVSLTFNQPMDRASTEAAFALLTPEGTAPGTFAWSADSRVMTFTLSGALAYGTEYAARLNASANAASGSAGLAAPYVLNFISVPAPAIVNTDPPDGTQSHYHSNGFRIIFAGPMDLRTLEPNIEVIPAPTQVFTYWNDYDSSFYLGWNLSPSTDYTVLLKPGMADPYGTTVAEGREVRFRTAPLIPEAFFNAAGVVGTYSAYADTATYVSTLNVDAFQLSLYRLSVEQFARLTGPDGYTVYQNYQPSAADLVREWPVDVDDALDERILTRVSLASAEGGVLAPGLYYLLMRAPGVDFNAYQFLSVSGANLTLKTAFDEALVWATDLNTGQPIANLPVTLHDRNFRVLAQGQTDADGLFSAAVAGRDSLWDTVYAVSQGGAGPHAFAVTLSDWSTGIEPWDFGLNAQYFRQEFTSYVYTDRPLYRPGQVVYFKGAVRREDDARFSLPDLGPVAVSIYNDQGEEVYKDTLELSSFGTFSGEFRLAGEAGLGFYNISVLHGDLTLGNVSFSVAEYRRPEFQVGVTSAVTEVVQGGTIPVTVEASFFFGGPVSDADVRWAVLSADYVFPFKGQGYYDFFDYDYSAGGTGPLYGTFGRLISEQTGKTDAQGRATLAVPADLSDASLSQLYTIEATVTDINGQQVSGRVEVVVHQGEFYVGVRPEEYVGTAGQPLNFNLTTVDWDSQPFPNQTLHVVFNDHQWNCALETDPETGADVWTCHVQDTEIASADVTTGPDGLATAAFTPPAGGVYQVKVTGTDSGGRTVTSSTVVWVASSDYVTWRQENNDRITLVADRRTYRPGDTAEILVPSPFQGETVALVTVERGRILQREVLRLTSNSTVYRLPITPGFAPDVFVTVVLVKGVDAANPAPAFKMGAVKLSVSPEQQALNVTLTPDKSKVGPRDTVTYALKATDYTGRPVQAEFSVGVVDLAVLSLSAPNSGPILEAFYGERALGVRTGTGLTLSIDRLNAATDQAKGGGGGAEAGFDEVRSRFLDTAYWNAVVTTDANGEASVSVTLPDNLTTWRLDARGLTADTLVGQDTVDILATKDLLIRPETPRFFVVGDQAELGAVINNNTAQDIQANVTLAGTGVSLTSPAAHNITVPANGRSLVTWQVTVQDVSAVDLTFSVEGGGLSDASKPTLGLPPDQLLPVYKYSAPETVATAGQLEQADSVLEAVSLPRRFDVTQGDLTIQLEPSLAAGLTGALEYLEHFPYECTEQTVSRFLPNVLTFRALKDLGLADPDLEAQLVEQVNTGLQQLYARQKVDGGWGWWTQDPSDPYITAYVVFGMVKSQQSGFSVNQGVIDSAITFLQNSLETPRETSEVWKLNRQAFILYALAEAGRGNTSATVQLYDSRLRLDTYGRAFLALAFSLIDPGDTSRVRTLLSDINSAAILSASGAHWEEASRDWWNMNTDTRSTAIVLDTLVRLDPQNNLIPNAVRWLMSARTAQAWETTQETVWALIGLTDWMAASGELKGNYEYAVSLNGNLLSGGRVSPDNVRESVTLQVAVADLLREQANRLLINRGAGDGRLYYTAHLNVYLPVEEVRAVSRGVIVSREYTLKSSDCGGPKQPKCPAVTEAAAGQDIQVRVTLIAPNDLYYVVLEDPIPAGTEAVDTSLLTTSVVGQAPQLSLADPLYYGWGWWWFSNTDLRDEKVVLFATYLPKGTYEYVYTLHASLAGVYKVIPTQAREFYFPEVFGRGDGMVFTIKP